MSSISNFTKSFVLPMSVTGLLLVSCSSQSHSDTSVEAVTAEAETGAPVKTVEKQTVKPGAAVSFSNDLAGPLTSGIPAQFQIKVREGYDSGILKVTLSTGEELNLGLTPRTYSFDMATPEAHLIDVSVTGYFDGRHYLHLAAEVDLPNGRIDRRVQSIAVQVGDDVPATKGEQNGKIETSADGETVIMMEAEEIIE